MGRESRIVVVGSANEDLILEVEDIPAPGATVLARSSTQSAGAKGAHPAAAPAPPRAPPRIAAAPRGAAGGRRSPAPAPGGGGRSRPPRPPPPGGATAGENPPLPVDPREGRALRRAAMPVAGAQ